jgi:FkbM family methyltransferase
MKLSYAQNLEDVYLQRVFDDVDCGVYVDVGGGHPVADNVSFWFYLRGWRGLIVEPQEALAAAYRHIRPRDTVFQGLAGAVDGEADFHAVDGLHGLSSMMRDAAERAGQFGAAYRTLRMPLRRLDGLITDAGLDRIDFLKVDVEGAEDQVLAGLDLARFRPRVIVVEAVNPGNPDGAAGAWEAPLLAADYLHAFFDNLNRYYVSRESFALAARFPAGPLPWNSVDHLWDHGRAPRNPKHADHAFARILEHGFFALLPSLGPELLGRLVREGLKHRKLDVQCPEILTMLSGTAEFPGPEPMPDDLEGLLATDRLRAAFGRIACFYDGGHIVEE